MYKDIDLKKILGVALLSACLTACGGGGGSSDNDTPPTNNGNGGGDGGNGSGDGSDGGDGSDAPESSARLHGIQGFYAAPSLVQVLFQAFDEEDEPKPGLTLADFTITNDGTDITNSEESLAAIAPATGLGFTLPTVFALDVSASVSDSEIQQAVAQLRAILLEEVKVENGSEGETELSSKLLDGQQIAIVIYDGDITTQLPFTRNVTLIDNALTDLANFVRAARPDNSSTNLYGATRYALNLWQDSFTSSNIVQGYAVIISDGNDEANPGAKDDTIAFIQDSGKRVFTIPTSTDATELHFLASNPEYALATTDFDQLGEELTSVSARIQNILNAIYVLEFSSPRRDGSTYELGITYSTGAGEPTIRGTYNTAGFNGDMPAELRINGLPVAQNLNTLSSTIINLQPGESVELTATTRWKGKGEESSYSWIESNSAGAISLEANSGETITLTANSEVGSEYITVTDENVLIGAGNVNPVSEDIYFYVSETDVTASNLHIASGQSVSLVATSSAANKPIFAWATTNSACRLSATRGDEVTVTSSTTTYGHCGVTVTDSANANARYYIPMTYGRQGTPIELINEQPVAPLYDFESGSSPDERFSPWTVVSANNADSSNNANGNYILQAAPISHGQTSSFEFVSVSAESISFDYSVSSEQNYDTFEFYIDGVQVLQESGAADWQTYTSETLSSGSHTFTWVYRKDVSESGNSDTAWVDNIRFE
ncbi:vWA domain-containing protein [uncultured Microbulbifer sp.]|uniref:vWA domain-containing protein n=1 Tax=uncultured Microbulbifer sp. TaxID=348147 RepID=UPI002619E63E|nr:vWA domain-containing protein [uncultured Microbulbifer sp.]